MTLAEIKKLQKLLEESPGKVKKFLDDELLIKQHKQGLIEVDAAINKEQKKTVKAFPLSENLCVVKWGVEKIEDFNGFRGKMSLTHIKSGMRIETIKIKKAEAIRLAERLEKLANLNFITKEECNKINNIDQINKLRNAIFEYSV